MAVTVLLSKYVPGWDGVGTPTEWHQCVPILKALSTKWARHDAHFMPYRLQVKTDTGWEDLEEVPRLKKDAFKRLEARNLRAIYEYGVADVDCDAAHKGNVEVPDAWRIHVRGLASTTIPGCCRYDTKRGLRIIWKTPYAMAPDEYLEYMVRSRSALRSAGLPVDELKDAGRCFRLPFVLRDGEFQNLWADLHEPEVWEPPAVAAHSSDWGRIASVQAPFQLPDVIDAGQRHNTLMRYAASLRAKGMDKLEIEAAVREADLTRCQPPMQSESDGERDLAGIIDWCETLPEGLSAEFAAKRMVADADTVFDRGSNQEIAAWVIRRLEEPTTGMGEDGGPVKIVYALGHVWLYDAPIGRYTVCTTTTIQNMILQAEGLPIFLGNDKKTGAPKYKPISMRASTVRDIIELIHMARANPTFFDDAEPGVCFSDAFVRVRTGYVERVGHSPAWRCRIGYEFPYTEAEPKLWLTHLDACWQNDDDTERERKVKTLNEWIGVTLIGKQPKFAKVATFLGGGNNGKSATCAMVEGVFPPNAVAHLKPQDLGQEYYRAQLSNVLLNVSPEMPSTDIREDAAAAFKAISSGDMMMGRFIRESPFEFRPKAGLIISLNTLPHVRDTSSGFFRRILGFSFEREFLPHEVDRDIVEKVLAEDRAKIVCYTLRQASNAFARNGYEQSPNGDRIAREWRLGSDVVEQWLQEQTQGSTPPDGTTADTCYQDYRMWAERNGLTPILNAFTFYRGLKSKVEQFWGGTNIKRERRYAILLAK